MFVACLPLALVACATDDSVANSPAELYREASDLAAQADYEKAGAKYAELEATYPNSRYARQSQLDIAHLHYRNGEYDEAVVECDRFIELNPGHSRLDYAHYLRGLSHLQQRRGFLNELFGESIDRRDPRALYLAHDDFELVLDNYPRGAYAAAAAEKLRLIIAALASHEIHAARYYLSRRAYPAAAARAEWALKRFPDSPSNREALLILEESYRAMGLAAPAADALRVRERNFPSPPPAAAQ